MLGLGGGVYESIAGQWVQLNDSPIPDNSGVSSLAVDKAGNVYAATFGSNIYQLLDGKWVLKYSYAGGPINSIALLYNNS